MKTHASNRTLCKLFLFSTLMGAAMGSTVAKNAVFISGHAEGLRAGEKVTLVQNNTDPLVVDSNTSFSFSTPVSSGGEFKVTVSKHPLTRTCHVINGSGVVGENGVSDLVVKCEASELTTLFSFPSAESLNPTPLIQARDGHLYGTTEKGGEHKQGSIFRYDLTAGLFTVLHSFIGTDGRYPSSPLVEGDNGNLYGVTSDGPNKDLGVIYMYNPVERTFKVVHAFSGKEYGPSSLIKGADGNLYGTTIGGDPVNLGNSGTIFKFDLQSNVFTKLYELPWTGRFQTGAMLVNLAQGFDGKFYGTTIRGGTQDAGTIFKFDLSTPTPTYTVLHNFTDKYYAHTTAPLIQGSDRSLYGLISMGSAADCAVFKYDPIQNIFSAPYVEFNNGVQPESGLIHGTDGNFYGTSRGWWAGAAKIFSYNPDDGKANVLADFTPVAAIAPSTLIIGSDNKFYGTTTLAGGKFGYGTIFKY